MIRGWARHSAHCNLGRETLRSSAIASFRSTACRHAEHYLAEIDTSRLRVRGEGLILETDAGGCKQLSGEQCAVVRETRSLLHTETDRQIFLYAVRHWAGWHRAKHCSHFAHPDENGAPVRGIGSPRDCRASSTKSTLLRSMYGFRKRISDSDRSEHRWEMTTGCAKGGAAPDGDRWRGSSLRRAKQSFIAGPRTSSALSAGCCLPMMWAPMRKSSLADGH